MEKKLEKILNLLKEIRKENEEMKEKILRLIFAEYYLSAKLAGWSEERILKTWDEKVGKEIRKQFFGF